MAEDKTVTPAVKAKRTKKIFIGLVILLVAGLLTWGALVLIKRLKAKKTLAGEKEKAAGSTSTGSSGSGSLNTQQNVLAVQKAINRDHPEAALAEDGVMGPKTQAAIIKYYGSGAFPLSSESMTRIIGGNSVPSSGGSAPAEGNNEFPLQVGSKGSRVVAVKQMLNEIKPGLKLNDKNEVFDQATYLALITHAGSRFYPVTSDNFFALNTMYNNYKNSNASGHSG